MARIRRVKANSAKRKRPKVYERPPEQPDPVAALRAVIESRNYAHNDGDREAGGIVRLRLFMEVEDPYDAVVLFVRFQELALALGYVRTDASSLAPGSIWATFRARVNTLWTRTETKRAANIARRTIESWGADRPLANNTAKTMEATAGFVSAIESAGDVTADFGNVVIAQYIDPDGVRHLRVKSFSARELAERTYDDDTMRDPLGLWRQLPPAPQTGEEVEEDDDESTP